MNFIQKNSYNYSMRDGNYYMMKAEYHERFKEYKEAKRYYKAAIESYEKAYKVIVSANELENSAALQFLMTAKKCYIRIQNFLETQKNNGENNESINQSL